MFLQTTLQSDICSQSYWAPKSQSPIWHDFGTCTRESRERKTIWMQAPWLATEYTIRGKVVASLKFGPWLVQCVCVARGSSQHQGCSNYALTILLVNSSQSHFGAPTRPSTPQSVVSQGACPDSSLFRCLLLGFTFESFKELGVRHLPQVSLVIIVEAFDLQQVPLRLLHCWFLTQRFFLIIMCSQLTLAPLAFVPTFTSTTQVGMLFLGDPIPEFTFLAWRAFILHALHHFHKP